MKTFAYCLISASMLCPTNGWSQIVTYTNFIRQIQYPSGVVWFASVAANGEQFSNLAIDPGGANFELWTVSYPTVAGYLLGSTYVGTYIPVAKIQITSEDRSSDIPRTRADRPFYVDVTVSGLRTGASDPLASKSVQFLRHVQSYGENGTGVGIDQSQALLVTQSSISTIGTQRFTFLINAVPGAKPTKVRGEERFSICKLADYQAPASELDGQRIQIWPVAEGTITGITSGQLIRYSFPQLTLTLKDLYPNSRTYAQVYKGKEQLGTTGTVITASWLPINDSVPASPQPIVLNNYDAVFDSDGDWTIELITTTPFGTERLAYVTFPVDRTMKVNGSFTSLE